MEADRSNSSTLEELRILREEVETLRRRLDAVLPGDPPTPTPAPAPDLAALEAEPLTPPDADPRAEGPGPAADDRTDRRNLLRGLGVGAAGVVASSAAAVVASASPAAANNNDAILVGNNLTGTNGTKLTIGTGGNIDGSHHGFAVTDGATNSPLLAGAALAGIANSYASPFSVGLYARGSVAVYAESYDNYAVIARTGTGYGIYIEDGGPPPPTRGGGQVGVITTDVNGDLWACTAPGGATWRKLAGTTTAGSLHVLGTTTRIYDSRPGEIPLAVTKGAFTDHQERTIDATLAGVPAGATAVLINATATNTNPGGFFAFFRSGAWPGNSSLNWGLPNATVANLAVVGVDAAAAFKARCEGPGGADLVIDCIGYYR